MKIGPCDALKEAKSFRIHLTKAVDDTGADLLDVSKSETDFQGLERGPVFRLRMKNPSRKAAAISEISGEIEFLLPKKDPAAAVTIDSFQKSIGLVLEPKELKSAGIELTPWTGDRYQAFQEGRVTTMNPDVTSFGQRRKPNEIVLMLRDPNRSYAGAEFRDEKGARIEGRNVGWGSNGEGKTFNFSFETVLPESTKLVVFIATPKSLMRQHFVIRDIALP